MNIFNIIKEEIERRKKNKEIEEKGFVSTRKKTIIKFKSAERIETERMAKYARALYKRDI